MKLGRPILLVTAFIGVAIVIQRLSGLGPAPVPKVFAEGLTLDGAIERGRTEKKPVFVFATADWCGPCQVMKRTVLSEPSVAEQIARDFVPAYVDLDKTTGAAERLRVISIPATLILWDGKQVARMEAVVPHDSYQKWLEAAHAQAVSDTPFVERASDEFIRNLNEKTGAGGAAPGEESGSRDEKSAVPPG